MVNEITALKDRLTRKPSSPWVCFPYCQEQKPQRPSSASWGAAQGGGTLAEGCRDVSWAWRPHPESLLATGKKESRQPIKALPQLRGSGCPTAETPMSKSVDKKGANLPQSAERRHHAY